MKILSFLLFFFFQAEDGIRDGHVTGVQTCALPISCIRHAASVHPEPGSNSPFKFYLNQLFDLLYIIIVFELFFNSFYAFIIIQFSKIFSCAFYRTFLLYHYKIILSTLKLSFLYFNETRSSYIMVEGDRFELPNPKEQIYSLPRLATSLPLHFWLAYILYNIVL